jgi:HSP20 family protein
MHNTLTISGERSEESSTGGEGADKKTPVRYERSYGSFSRSFTLPPHVDTDAITATAKEGVLTVTIPKKPEQKPQPKEIAVE